MKLVFLLLALILFFVNRGVSGVETVSVSVMEGDSVTLNTGVKTNQQYIIKWYFNNIRIAQIYGDQSFICTDVQCHEGTERFRDRLKLDHQTGSLIIMNIRITDEGEYKLQMISSSSDSEKIFAVSVHSVFGAGLKEASVSVKEGDSVTLHTGVKITQQEDIKWYFYDTLITEISGDQSKICTDVQCNERFRDRLKLDHQTGSLNIMNTRNTDSGLYKLIKMIINSSSFSITRVKRFSVSVIVAGSGLSSTVVAGIVAAVVGVVLLAFPVVAVVALIYCRCRRRNSTPAAQCDIPLYA